MNKTIKKYLYISILTFVFFKISLIEGFVEKILYGKIQHAFSIIKIHFFSLEHTPFYPYYKLKTLVQICLVLLIMFVINITLFKLLKYSFRKYNINNNIVLCLAYLLLLILIYTFPYIVFMMTIVSYGWT